MLDSEEQKIWNLALPFQDKRHDKGHAEVVTYFAQHLLSYFPGERKVIIPAAILHDAGWSQMTREEIALFNAMIDRREKDPNMEKVYNPVLRQRHQELGVRFAKELLEKQKISKKYIPHILEIISQHDTRQGFYSQEDELVRSADRLWRFVFPSIIMTARKWGWTTQDFIKSEKHNIDKPDFFPNDEIRKIAHLELEHAIKQAEKMQEELEIAIQEYRREKLN